ncbi:E3 ubiquitin-protein ligase RNF25 [Anopheles cruzii]|uniref:E3 ubiquitin-protein ligase RNF25 n=1 Tax=Anopheles cruzii TaxID=68878 RepID=UPI0022EC8D54|nr:E3 ubiquitin-protein ligase RNF25 [Anopheles cruzii]
MDALLDEVESLEAILMDDVQITRNSSGFPELIETTVFPTVGEELNSQYVCITLQVMPVPGYPEVRPPNIKLKNPRGLDDGIFGLIDAAVKDKLSESLGQPVVFDLIDIIREQLTESNLPSGQCVICLYGFLEGDQFTKTVCYHYLHSHCLACHINASRRNYEEEREKLPIWKRKEAKPFQAQCPVCREPIDVEVEPLAGCRPPVERENAPKFRLTDELKSLQAQMTRLFMHQKNRGGIIDLDAEEGNVIAIETEPPNGEVSKNTNELSSVAAVSVETLRNSSASSQQAQGKGKQPPASKGSGSKGAKGGGNRHSSVAVALSTNPALANGTEEESGSGCSDPACTGSPVEHHRGGHRNRRHNNHHHNHRHARHGNHYHHHHHHHHGGRGANGGAVAGGGSTGGGASTSSGATGGSAAKNLTTPCTSDAR